MGPGLRSLQNVQIIDLSVPISSKTAEPQPPQIEYVHHRRAADELATLATRLLRDVQPDSPAISTDAFRDGLGLANENLFLDSHAGTHLDAPWHFGPLCENKPAKTIDQIPLEWCWGPGVRLDLRHKKAGELITPQDLSDALARLSYSLNPFDIVLLMTGADRRFGHADYFAAHPGMGRDATLWLIDHGIKVAGIDAWGFDRPAGAMLRDYVHSHDADAILPAHMVGREREYCHIEKLANLDKIPCSTGFWVSCFPIKIERGSAGWTRAVALVERS
jgi:kynurenine formamidase